MRTIVILILATILSIASKAMGYESFTNVRIPYDANTINCICQDSHDIIWIGSKRGLLCYNGYDFHQFSKNAVQAIVQIGDFLCIGSDNGIWWHNLNTGLREERFKQLNKIGAVRSLAVMDSALWIGTRDEGLFIYDFKTNKLDRFPFGNKKETIIFALESTSEVMFVGSHEGLHLHRKPLERESILNSGIVYALYMDGNYLWVGAEGAFYKYNVTNNLLERVLTLEGNAVKTIKKDNIGRLLLGTNEGLLVCDAKSERIERINHSTRSPNSLCNNVVNDILCDKNNNVWLATNNGISIAQMQPLYQTTHLSELITQIDGNVFECSLIDSHQDYWLGGENGLLHISGKKVKWWNVSSGLRHNHIRYIYEDLDGEVWIASDGSVACYNRQTDTFSYYTIVDRKGNTANWAYCLYEDDAKRLWIGTYMGGLYIIEKQELLSSNGHLQYNKHFFGNDEHMVSTVYQMFPDEKGNLWLNTGQGLAYLDTKSLKIDMKNIWLDNMTYADGAVWLSSLGHLMRYNPPTKKAIELPFPAGSGIIHAFVKENHRVWFACAEGLYYIDTSNNQIHSSFTPEGDLYSGAYDQLRNEILWGGEDEITHYHINRLDSVNLLDSIFVTGISVNGELITGYGMLRTPTICVSENRNIAFELSTLSFIPKGQEAYYYKLGEKGLWHSLGKGVNKLAFAEMPSGKNLLYLSTTNPDVNSLATITVYQILVPYPWYLSWWAITCGLAFFIGCLIVIVHYAQIHNKRKYEEREREKSLELSRQKMDFFVNVSHELKTPLSLIIAPLSRMIPETTNARQRESLKAIYKNSLRLNDLIYKILDFKRMEFESEDTLIRSHVELCSVLRNCIQAFQTETSLRHIIIEFNSTTDSLWMNADMLKLESVFTNLLSNAIKYVPDKSGKINITLTSEPDQAIITFADNGRGMADKDIPMMFVRFFQGRNARRGGTGIGLYLVKKFVELHEGTVEVHNAGGLTVKVLLPTSGENAITNQAGNEILESKDNKEATLLIIDDNQEIVDFLAESLSKTYTCLKAYNGLEGKQIVESRIPGLIIVDQMMPEMDGFEFCRWVRHNQPTVNVPLIMLTAKDDTATELESIKIGVDVFISKPFDIKKVQLHIAQLLQRKRSIEKTVSIEHITNPDFKLEDHRSADEILMDNITKTIEDNMEQESFNVTQLAQLLNIDQKQLYRKMKQLTGMTPIAYLKKLRMKKAAMLLKENRFTVSEVMYLVGYTNASYFSKCFSEELGMSPKQYVDCDLGK